MGPSVINYNEIFENTAFAEELNQIIFGAELALRYVNAPQTAMKDVKRNIIRSAFTPFSLNYDAMSGAAQSSGLKPAPRYADAKGAPVTRAGAETFTPAALSDGAEATASGQFDVDGVSVPDPGGSGFDYQDEEGEYDSGPGGNSGQSSDYTGFGDPEEGFDPDGSLSFDFDFDPSNISIGE